MSCLRFCWRMRDISPYCHAYLLVRSPCFIHAYVLDCVAGELYTVEWLNTTTLKRFVFLFSRFLPGKVVITYGDKYRNTKGIRVSLF